MDRLDNNQPAIAATGLNLLGVVADEDEEVRFLDKCNEVLSIDKEPQPGGPFKNNTRAQN